MTEPAAEATPQPGAAEPGQQTAEAKPPWGSAEEFTPDRAWDLIQNLRNDNQDLKAKNADTEALRGKVKEFEDAKLSVEEKAARDLTEAQSTNATLGLTNARLLAVLEHDALTIDDLSLIGGTTPEEIKDAAAKLAARLGSGTPTAPPANRPHETAPRGGGDPTTPATTQDWLRSALSQSDR